ncbi:hypothetical protein PAPHI01_0371 [Pancytospora philotis]|nr:hypothetical protein PAPHI01_0345 [Pancytospora philotis]KAI4291097.1 hypothetical protein PAPHI01_0371 [Pancytospora philotis]
MWNIAAVFAAWADAAADEVCSRKAKSLPIMDNISPLPGLFSLPSEYDRNLLFELNGFVQKFMGEKDFKRSKIKAASFRNKAVAKKAVQLISRYILSSPEPRDCLLSFIAEEKGLAKCAMLAEIIRNYTVMPEDDAAQLNKIRDGVLKILDEKIKAECDRAPDEFLAGGEASLGSYDILVYLFRDPSAFGDPRACRDPSTERKIAVRRRFGGILKAGYSDLNNKPELTPTYDKIAEMVKYMQVNKARANFKVYGLHSIITAYLAFKTDTEVNTIIDNINSAEDILTNDA